jgi:hypothetical protein
MPCQPGCSYVIAVVSVMSVRLSDRMEKKVGVCPRWRPLRERSIGLDGADWCRSEVLGDGLAEVGDRSPRLEIVVESIAWSCCQMVWTGSER